MKLAAGKYVGAYLALRLESGKGTGGGAESGSSAKYYDLLYRAYRDGGEREQYGKLVETMLADGFGADKLRAALEARMKKAEGVSSVDELTQRAMLPEEQLRYDRDLEALEASGVWDRAGQEDRDAALKALYSLTVGSKTGSGHQEKIDGGKDVGLDETEYLLYLVARSLTDEPSESGKSGTYTNGEIEAAIRMLPGLSDAERNYLWVAQGKRAESAPEW